METFLGHSKWLRLTMDWKQTNKNLWKITMIITREERGWKKAKWGRGGQIPGNERKLDFGWWVCSRVHRHWITILYTWKLYTVINQFTPKHTLPKKEEKVCKSTHCTLRPQPLFLTSFLECRCPNRSLTTPFGQDIELLFSANIDCPMSKDLYALHCGRLSREKLACLLHNLLVGSPTVYPRALMSRS